VHRRQCRRCGWLVTAVDTTSETEQIRLKAEPPTAATLALLITDAQKIAFVFTAHREQRSCIPLYYIRMMAKHGPTTDMFMTRYHY